MFPVADNRSIKRFPIIVLAIVVLNVWVFFREIRLSPSELENFIIAHSLIPARDFTSFVNWNPQNVLTSIFLHGGVLHLLMNLWSFWIFGDNVESEFGPLRFVVFYLLCGMVASLTHAVLNPHSMVPVVGASGAIAGVMGAYMLLFPGARIRMFTLLIFYPIFFEIPAVVFLLIWFLGQLFSGAATLEQARSSASDAGGIAFFAHIGGFVAGVLLMPFFRRKS